MTEQEARTKPISEVWERFSNIQDGLLLNHDNYPDHRKYLEDVSSILRAVLLERCELFPSNAPAKGQSLVEYHTECAAWHSFWAWELNQRQLKCKRDNTEMVQGIALHMQEAYFVADGSYAGRIAPPKLVKCLKCPKCGHSVTI